MSCDEQCLRELLAGVELELGDRDAEIAKQRARADESEMKKWLYGAGGVAFGVLMTIIASIGVK